jgi:hypothetical protein
MTTVRTCQRENDNRNVEKLTPPYRLRVPSCQLNNAEYDDESSSQPWTSRAIAPNETCPAFDVQLTDTYHGAYRSDAVHGSARS